MIPILLVGPPGIGKTAKVKAQFDHVEVLLLSSAAEEDISGLPFLVDGEEGRTTPAFIRRLQKAAATGKTTCLFLDELDKARREVADTLLSLVVDPVSFGLPETTTLRAAANPPEWGGGDGISDAMLSRWCVVEEQMNGENVNQLLAYWNSRYKNNQEINQYIEEIISVADSRGLVEVSGEKLNKRITCPRTITMLLDSIVRGDDKINLLAAGLLTPSFASVFSKNEKITSARKAAKIALKREPLRI